MSMKIEEVKSSELLSRIATHTHIKGLGMRDDGSVIPIAAGLVGQEAAREAAATVVDLIKTRKMAGKALLMAGAPGTGQSSMHSGLSVAASGAEREGQSDCRLRCSRSAALLCCRSVSALIVQARPLWLLRSVRSWARRFPSVRWSVRRFTRLR